MTNKKEKRTFTEKFKLEAVSLIIDQNYTYKAAHQKMDISPSALRKWVDKFKRGELGVKLPKFKRGDIGVSLTESPAKDLVSTEQVTVTMNKIRLVVDREAAMKMFGLLLDYEG